MIVCYVMEGAQWVAGEGYRLAMACGAYIECCLHHPCKRQWYKKLRGRNCIEQPASRLNVMLTGATDAIRSTFAIEQFHWLLCGLGCWELYDWLRSWVLGTV